MHQPRHHSLVRAIVLGGLMAVTATAATAQTAPDNTKVNKRDRAEGAVTADQQKETAADRELASKIRKALVKDDTLDAETARVAGLIARNRLEALVFLKAALRMADRTSPEVGVDYERELIALCYSFPDREARIRAFRDRKPRDSQA
jgi:hypothetical protein